GAQEQAVGHLHDIGFVDGVNLFAAVAFRVVERESGDASGSFLGDDFEAFHDARDDFMLETGVKVFGGFANDDDIEILNSGLYAREIFDWAKLGVENERLPHSDVDAGRTAGNRGGGRPFEGDAVAAYGIDGGLVDRTAAIILARFDLFPVDLDACGFENPARGQGYFGSDAFAGKKCDFVSHRAS